MVKLQHASKLLIPRDFQRKISQVKSIEKLTLLLFNSALTNVLGVIGEAILPHDYAIDQNGNIQVGDHLITSATVEYMEHDKCHKIPYEDVKHFYKRPLAEYELKGKFVSPSDAFGRIVVDESPK